MGLCAARRIGCARRPARMSFPDIVADLKSIAPDIRGRLTANAPLAEATWFRVGGPAQVLFSPADPDDLAYLLGRLPPSVPVLTMGLGSNLIVRDGGVEGVVIRLGGRAFNSHRCSGRLSPVGRRRCAGRVCRQGRRGGGRRRIGVLSRRAGFNRRRSAHERRRPWGGDQGRPRSRRNASIGLGRSGSSRMLTWAFPTGIAPLPTT